MKIIINVANMNKKNFLGKKQIQQPLFWSLTLEHYTFCYAGVYLVVTYFFAPLRAETFMKIRKLLPSMSQGLV